MPPDADLHHNQALQAFANSSAALTSKDSMICLLEALRKFHLACKHSSDIQSLLSRLMCLCHTYCELAQISGKTSKHYAHRAVLSAQRAHAVFTIAPTEDPLIKSGVHHSLGVAFLHRYICLANDDDLDMAISELGTSVNILPPNAPDTSKASHTTYYALAICLSSRRLGLRHPDPKSMQQYRVSLSLCDAVLKTSPILLTYVTSGLVMLLGVKEFVLAINPGRVIAVNTPAAPASGTHMEFGNFQYMQQVGACMGIWQTVAIYGTQATAKLGSITGQLGCLASQLLCITSSNDVEPFNSCVQEVADLLEHCETNIHLHHAYILIDILSVLVWQRERHHLSSPGLVEKIEHHLDTILPDTHFLRPELHFRMGKWSQVEQKEIGRTMSNYYINHAPAIQRFRKSMELSPDFHPQQFYYIAALAEVLVQELTAPTTVTRPPYKSYVIDELRNLCGIMKLFSEPWGINTGDIDAMIDSIQLFSDRDPTKHVGVQDTLELFECLNVSGTAGTLASVSNLRLLVAANGLHNMGFSESQSRQFVEELLHQWQEMNSRRSDPGLVDIDIDFGLGESLLRQGQLTLSYGGDLQEALRVISNGIDYMNRSVHGKIASTPIEIGNIVTLGEAYFCRHLAETRRSNLSADITSNDLEVAVATFRSAGMAADSLGLPPIALLFTFNPWAAIADEYTLPSAIEAYTRVLDAQSQIAWAGFDIQARYESRRRLIGLSNNAAKASCYACMVGNAIKAVEFLEKIKSTLHSQNLALRLSCNHIRMIDPLLADEAERIGKAIEEYSLGRSRNNLLPTDQNPVTEQHQNSQILRALGHEWDQVLARIRKIDGCQNLLKAPSVQELCAASINGPVALIVTSKFRGLCYGIVIKRPSIQDISIVQLPLTAQKAEELANEFDITVSDHVRHIKENRSNVAQRHFITQNEPDPPDAGAYSLLTDLWRLVMRPIIQCIRIDAGLRREENGLPHLWLSVTGPLSSLPLHAAGEYDCGDTSKSECVLEHVICSYAPSLSTLIRDPPSDDKKTKLFTLSGGAGLNKASSEVNLVHEILGKCATMTSLDKHASINEVKLGLRDAHIAHFACHGLQDPTDPLKSRLSFSGRSDIELLELMSEPRPNARLAVLLACETAKGDKVLLEESLHIAGTMLFAGYRGVVGTLWPMQDQDGPTLCTEFYNALIEGVGDRGINYGKAGLALHRGMRKLKDSGVSVFRWAPFIHLGQ